MTKAILTVDDSPSLRMVLREAMAGGTRTLGGAPASKARARAAGATGWIAKPFDPEKLNSAIRRVIH